MKKQTLLALLLAGACAFSSFALTGCGDKEASAKASEETTEAPKELSLPVYLYARSAKKAAHIP